MEDFSKILYSLTWAGKMDRSEEEEESGEKFGRNSIDFRFKRDSFSIYGIEDPWIDYGWIYARCTKGDEREAGLGTRARGNVRGWLGRERER